MVDWRRLLYCLSPYIPPPIIPIVLPRVVFVAKAWAGSPLITLLPALTTRTASLSNQLYCALSFICGRTHQAIHTGASQTYFQYI